MSWLIAGTVPDESFPLIQARAELKDGKLLVDGHEIEIARGTPALAAFTCAAAKHLGVEAPEVLLVGDTGKGRGSKELYAHLVQVMDRLDHVNGFTFHYLQPDVYWHNQVLWAIQEKLDQPCLVADAGFMYVAKMSGFAADYDLFTPDIGEMCFLADEIAPHPFYTRGFLLEDESKVEEYIQRAYAEKNAARYLMVKGEKDYVVREDEILFTVSKPKVEAMEAIGGTGDSLTGLVSAYLMNGKNIPEACRRAALTNRYLGLISEPTPAFKIGQILPFMGQAMDMSCRENDLSNP